MKHLLHIVALTLVIQFQAFSADKNAFAELKKSFPGDASFFPIGVWLQNTKNAGTYKAMGVNYYYGLWAGPTEAQISDLKQHGMYVICQLNDYAEKQLIDEPTVIGWMHRDEPDLAHVYPRNKIRADKSIIKDKWPEVYKKLDLDNKQYEGWGMGAHPINDIQADYKRYKKIDPKRPVFLQLSKAVALEGKTQGRGSRSGETWEYPLYIEGSDAVSFDIYPVAYGNPDKLWQVAKGVDQLRQWGTNERPLMVAIEAGFGETSYANQDQQRAQIWMAINHGARGIFWFCHRWQNKKLTSEAMPLTDPKVGKAVTAINKELHSLAAVINSEQKDVVTTSGAEIDVSARVHDGATYIFAVERANKSGKARFVVKGVVDGKVEVIGEGRTIEVKDGKFEDEFGAFDTNLYRITK